MAVESLRLCADKPGPSLAANAFHTDISCRFCTKTMHYLVFILCPGVFRYYHINGYLCLDKMTRRRKPIVAFDVPHAPMRQIFLRQA